jgi:hypothetical protein
MIGCELLVMVIDPEDGSGFRYLNGELLRAQVFEESVASAKFLETAALLRTLSNGQKPNGHSADGRRRQGSCSQGCSANDCGGNGRGTAPVSEW